MKRILSLLLVVVISLTMLLNVVPVSASGYVTTNYNITACDSWAVTSPMGTFASQANRVSSTVYTSGIDAGVQYHGTGSQDDWYSPIMPIIKFNVGTFSPETVNSAVFHVWINTLTNQLPDVTRYALFTYHSSQLTLDPQGLWIARTESTFAGSSTDYYGRLTDWVNETSITAGAYYDFNILSTALNYIKPNNNGYIFLALIPECWITKVKPTNGVTNVDLDRVAIDITATHQGYLTINYLPKAQIKLPLSYGTKVSIGTKTTSGSITAIAWHTPRLAFNNNDPQFYITGTANLGLNLVLENDGGTVTTLTDQIGTNGTQYSTLVLPANFTGWVRCRDTVAGKASTWGYFSPPLSDSMTTNSTCVNNTAYPQRQSSFDKYLVSGDGKTALIYFKTNIGSGSELTDHNIRIYQQGINYIADPTKTIINMSFNAYRTLTGVNDTLNDGNLGVGFLVVSTNQPAGFNTRDSLITNLNLTANTNYWGFYQPVIWKVSTASELTTTLSSLWYLKEGEKGIKAVVDSTSYNAGDPIKGSISCSGSTYVPNNLNTLNVNLISEAGTVINSASGTYSGELTQYAGILSASDGNWIVQYALSKSGCSYTYYYDIPIVVGGGSGVDPDTGEEVVKGLNEKLSTRLKAWGMDDQAGHWGFMLGLMLLVGVFFGFLVLKADDDTTKKIFACVLAVIELLIFGAFLATGFIDVWVIVLLALCAGGVIFGIIVKAGNRGGA